MATAFAILVTIVIVGWLWFFIVRPILEDYNVIGPRIVNYYQPHTTNAAPGITSSTPVREQFEPSEPEPVRGDTHQAEPVEPAVHEPVREPGQLNRLSRRAEIIMLATQRNEDGSYRHSANQITAFMGGTAAEVKDIIREVRGEAKPAPVVRTERRPANGW